MKKFLPFPLLVLCAAGVIAQDAASDPLAYTLPNGKVLHFETPEQKAKFLAARERLTPPQAARPAPTAPAVFPMGNTALDHTETVSGKVDLRAPKFSARYYMFDPASWVGKEITLGVMYVRASTGSGLVHARTGGAYGRHGRNAEDEEIDILTSPEIAGRLVTQCGTTPQLQGSRFKVTLIKGKFVEKAPPGSGQYAVAVERF